MALPAKVAMWPVVHSTTRMVICPSLSCRGRRSSVSGQPASESHLPTEVGQSELAFGQLGSGSQPAEPSEVHEPDQVGQLHHLGRLLLHQHDGHAEGPQVGQRPDHLEAGQRGETQGGLVGDEDLRRSDQRRDQAQHLLLATRERPGQGAPSEHPGRRSARRPCPARPGCAGESPGSPRPSGKGRSPGPREPATSPPAPAGGGMPA